MNKQTLPIISALAILAGLSVASVYAAPVNIADQSAGLLGSPIAQLPLQDPVVQQAVDWIQIQNAKPEEHKLKSKPETTIVRSRFEHRYIMGGPEIIPM